MSLDAIDREAMREGQAVSKLRALRGSRVRAKGEDGNQQVNDDQIKRAWDSIREKK